MRGAIFFSCKMAFYLVEDEGIDHTSSPDHQGIAASVCEHFQGIMDSQDIAIADQGNFQELLRFRDKIPVRGRSISLHFCSRVQCQEAHSAGFVVEKFALFLKQIAHLLGSPVTPSPSLRGYSAIFGVLLVALGVLICLLSFIKYKKVERQIEDQTYHPSPLLDVMLTLSVLLIGIFLAIYLSSSI